MADERPDMLNMSLSILLAAAVAHVLYMFAIYLPGERTDLWFLFSVGIIALTLMVITHVIKIKKSESTKKQGLKIEIGHIINFMNILLIGALTINIFAVVRFVYFYTTQSSTYILPVYSNIWLIGIGTSVIISFIGCCEYYKYEEKIVLGIGGIFIFLSILFLCISEFTLKMMGVLPSP